MECNKKNVMFKVGVGMGRGGGVLDNLYKTLPVFRCSRSASLTSVDILWRVLYVRKHGPLYNSMVNTPSLGHHVFVVFNKKRNKSPKFNPLHPR